MHVDRVDLSAIQPMDVGATLPSDGCPQLRERHGPFHSTPPLVGSKRGIRNEHGRLDFRPFLNERGFRGSLYFNAARSNGLNFWQSIPFAA